MRQEKAPKIPLSLFCIGMYCRAWDQSVCMGCVPSEMPLEKANFSSVNGYQLEIAFWLQMGARGSLSHLSPESLSGWDRFRPYACCHLLCELTCASILLYPEDPVSLYHPSFMACTVLSPEGLDLTRVT